LKIQLLNAPRLLVGWEKGRSVKRGEKGEGLVLRLFHKKGQAIKNWRNRALLIDFRTTHLTIIEDENNVRKVPAWAYKKFVQTDN
jgi:hypothetical protein